MDAVQTWIARGDLGRGQPLPPMRRLAKTLSVDKATVCRALSSLQDDGLVRRQGRRLHVADHAASSPQSLGVLGDTVLVVTAADPHADAVRRNWLGRVIEGLLGEAHTQHCNAMIVHPQRLGDQLARLVAARPMGLVMLGVDHTGDTLEQIEQTGLPVVLYGDEFEAHGHDMITPDHVEGTASLTRWLIERGARRILRIWPHRTDTRQRPIWLGHRDRGFEQAVNDVGVPVLPPVEYHRPDLANITEDHFDHRVREVAGRLVEYLTGPEPIDAVMLPTDGFVPEVAAACRLFGKEPNKDVLIAGYDNDWATATYRDREPTPPAVTTDHDSVHLGQALLQTLLERAKNPASEPQRIALPPKVVEIAIGLTTL